MARSELRNLEAWTAEALQREAASVLLVPRADGRGRVPLHGWFVADEETRRAIAPGGALGDVDVVTPPRGETLEAHAARLLAQGVIGAPPKPWP